MAMGMGMGIVIGGIAIVSWPLKDGVMLDDGGKVIFPLLEAAPFNFCR